MFPIISARYWAERARRARDTERRRGWNWAAGELLAGKPIAEIERYTQESRDFDHDTAFDEGADDAVKAWKEKARDPR